MKVDLIEWVTALAGDHSNRVDEGAVQYQNHIVEDDHFEGRESGVDLLIGRLARDRLDQRPVGRELFIKSGLAVIEFFLGCRSCARACS